MRSLSTTLLAGVVSMAGLVAVTGCHNRPESDRTRDQAAQMDDAADMIRRGEVNVEEAKVLIARGDALRQQGNTVEGDKLLAEGRAREKLGNEQIAQGRALKSKAASGNR